jgi:hypothetical protein
MSRQFSLLGVHDLTGPRTRCAGKGGWERLGITMTIIRGEGGGGGGGGMGA